MTTLCTPIILDVDYEISIPMYMPLAPLDLPCCINIASPAGKMMSLRYLKRAKTTQFYRFLIVKYQFVPW